MSENISKLNRLTKDGQAYDLQDKELTEKVYGVTGIIKGDGAGALSAAVVGTDYDYPVIKGAGVPLQSTVGAVGQHYFNTTATKAPYEYVCIADTDGVYSWAEAGGGGVEATVIADEYKASNTYAIGDVVIYSDNLYKCTTTISSAEAWNPEHWEGATVDDLFSSLQTEIEILKTSVSEGKALVAEAVTDQGITTASDASFETIATNVSAIPNLSTDTQDATATAAQILTGQTAYVKGAKVTGTMANNGSVSKSITPSTSSQTYTIPAGYHSGEGLVTVAAAPTSLIDGTATAAQVLSGKTFFVDSYTAKTGTMANQGAVAPSALGAGGSYTIPAGYHNGSGKVTVQSLATITSGGTITSAAQILSGYKAYSDGTLYTGTMTNQGAKSTSLNCGGSYTIPAGYHNGNGKITANSLASQTSATATAAKILKGETAWVNGSKITGTLVAPTQYVETGTYTWTMNGYDGSTGNVSVPNLSAIAPTSISASMTLTTTNSNMVISKGATGTISRGGSGTLSIHWTSNTNITVVITLSLNSSGILTGTIRQQSTNPSGKLSGTITIYAYK